MRTWPALVAAAAVAAHRVGRRSGATAAEVAGRLPGDDLVPDANVVMDRATTLPGTAHELWPWLVQLGKHRGGWYMPRVVEMFLPLGGRAARELRPAYAELDVGTRIPDWGPGDPEFEVALLEAPNTLVFRSLRQRSRGRRWPVTESPVPSDTLRISWALVARDVPDGVRLHLRLRVRVNRAVTAYLTSVLGGMVDELTVRLLFAGLRERMTRSAQSRAGIP